MTIGIVVTTLLLTICTHNSDSQMITQVTWTITPNTLKNTIYPNFYDAWLIMIRLKNNYKLIQHFASAQLEIIFKNRNKKQKYTKLIVIFITYCFIFNLFYENCFLLNNRQMKKYWNFCYSLYLLLCKLDCFLSKCRSC